MRRRKSERREAREAREGPKSIQYGQRACGARSPGGFRCTVVAGHVGRRHAAHAGVGQRPLSVWT